MNMLPIHIGVSRKRLGDRPEALVFEDHPGQLSALGFPGELREA